jgi:hypothetical protein
MFPENIIIETRKSFQAQDLQAKKDLIILYASDYTLLNETELTLFTGYCLLESRLEASEKEKTFDDFYTWYHIMQGRPADSPITYITGSLVYYEELFDDFEVQPICLLPKGIEGVCEPKDADSYAAFVHATGLGVTCIAKVKTEEDAVNFVNIISAILQIMLDTPTEESLLEKKFTPGQLTNALLLFVCMEKKDGTIPKDPALLRKHMTELGILAA